MSDFCMLYMINLFAVLFFWVAIVALFALIDIFLLSYNIIKINQDKNKHNAMQMNSRLTNKRIRWGRPKCENMCCC